MNIVEVNLNESNYAKSSLCCNEQNIEIYSPLCNTVLTDNSQASLFENGSNNTRDSSLSSSCSNSYPTKATNLSMGCSNKSLDQSHNSNYSTPKLNKSPNISPKDIPMTNDLLDNNSLPNMNEPSKTSTPNKEEIVKITKALSLEFTCSTRITPPYINDCPEVVRSRYETDMITQDNEQQSVKTTTGSLQLISDQNKLTKSEFMINLRKLPSEYPLVDEKSDDIENSKFYPSREIQTMPVLILPLCTEDKMIETEESHMTKSKPETGSKDSLLNTIDNFIPSGKAIVEICHKKTQASAKTKPRTRTISEHPSTPKTKETFEEIAKRNSDVSSMQKQFWGDVYNDYKLTKKETDKEKLRIRKLQRAASTATPKFSSHSRRDTNLTGDDIDKRSVNIVETENLYGQTKTSSTLNTICKTNKNKVEAKGSVQLTKDELKCYRKCFQVQKFDEIVKSFNTPSDRRIRAVCSRVNCQIRLFGPSSRVLADSKSHISFINQEKPLYHLLIFTKTKEQLDKSLKCIQETFPKACLNERMIIQNNLENYGDEILL